MAIVCIEPQYLATMLSNLGISADEYGEQHDESQYARQSELFAGLFAKKS